MILPTKFSVVEKYIVLKCYVRFGSLADIGQPIRDVRFAPESGHVQRPASRTPTLGLLFRRRLVEASLCQGARSPVAMQGYGRRLPWSAVFRSSLAVRYQDARTSATALARRSR